MTSDKMETFDGVLFCYTVDEAIADGTLIDIVSEMEKPEQEKFSLGRLVITPGALAALLEADQSPFEFLRRHVTGDWGEVCKEDAKENEFSLQEGFRLLSAYRTELLERIWVITEADRSVTTILLPEEY
jgi:hypothetical protein